MHISFSILYHFLSTRGGPNQLAFLGMDWNANIYTLHNDALSDPLTTLTRLYKAMIRPQLEYGNAVWHPYLRKDIDSIEAVQKRFTKLIPGLTDLSYQDHD